MQKAAIGLGVDPARIEMLEGPSSTLEEARAFVERYGADAPVIVVTDAIHLPRAIRFFQSCGSHPYPAPTNYLVKETGSYELHWMPSPQNFLLMDRVLREWLGTVKATFE